MEVSVKSKKFDNKILPNFSVSVIVTREGNRITVTGSRWMEYQKKTISESFNFIFIPNLKYSS